MDKVKCNIYDKCNTKLALVIQIIIQNRRYLLRQNQKRPALAAGLPCYFSEPYSLKIGTAKLRLNKLTFASEPPKDCFDRPAS